MPSESSNQRLFLQRRWSLRWGECPHCGAADFQACYEGRRGLGVLGGLLLPLGRVHIHKKCTVCGVGMRRRLKEWRSMREARGLPLQDDLETENWSSQVASEMLECVAELGEPEELERLASRLESDFAQDAGILSKLAWCHGHFTEFEEARRLYRRAHELDPQAEREGLIRAYEGVPTTLPPRSPWPLGEWLRALVYPMLMIGLAVAGWLSSMSSQTLEIHLVNGLPKAYQVLVNEAAVTLPASGRAQIPLAAGTIRVEPVNSGLPFEPFQFTLYGGQVKGETLVVVNPDRSAVISWEELVYQNTEVSDDQRASADQFVLHVGEAFYFFDKVTDRFADPPTSFEVRSTEAETYRQVIHHLSEETPTELCTLLLGQGEMDLAEDFCRWRLSWNPEATGLLAFLRELAPDEASLAFMRERLPDRPVRFSWHRHYIDLAKALGKREAAEEEYARAVAEEPENASLHFLLGESRAERRQARADYGRAAALGSAEGHFMLSLWKSSKGEFELALGHVRAGLERQPGHRHLQAQEQDLLLALGQFDELIPELRRRLDDDPLDQVAAMELAGLAEASGNDELAELVTNRFLQAVELDRGDLPEAEAAVFRQLFAEVRAQWRGDIGAYLAASDQTEEPLGVNTFVLKKAYERAAAILEGEADAFLNLLLYALLGREGQLASAEVQLSQTLRMWEERGLPEQLELASWFRAEAEAPSVAQTLEVLMPNHQRRVLLVALAQRHPHRGEDYHALARKLNYQRVFPYLALQRHLEGGDASEK